jgi:hypothetical protein
MVLLPNNLDVDPGLADYNLHISSEGSSNSYRLWDKFFAPAGSADKVLVPRSWVDFCYINLLHPTRFEWLKTLMESNAWNIKTSKHRRKPL